VDRPQREARRQENQVASRLGGRVTPASGSGGIKNDVRSPEWSVEIKSTSRKAFPANRDVIETAEKQALRDGRRFALFAAFLTPGKPAKRYVLTSEDDWIELTERLKSLESVLEGRDV
jgi:hypothetical protein